MMCSKHLVIGAALLKLLVQSLTLETY